MKTETNFVKSTSNFNALMLKIGDMMEVTDTRHTKRYLGIVILKTYSQYVNLNNPSYTWEDGDCTLEGRKLLPGESITLIQE